MKALSIRRPWPWVILHLGKRIENRTWYCSYRGPVLLHVAKGCTADEYVGAEEWMYRRNLLGDTRRTPMGDELSELWLPELADMPCGGIVARAEIVDCLRPHNGVDFKRAQAMGLDRRWWHDQETHGVVLAAVREIPFTPWRGDRGLFEVDETKLRAA